MSTYTIRPVEETDFQGFCEVLKVLTTVGSVSSQQFTAQIEYWRKTGDYHVMVIVDDQNTVLATGTLFIERKIIHECGRVGHIEDIAVSTEAQGKKLGKQMIDYLAAKAKELNCYKTILDCDEKNVKFYEKCGFSRAGVEMSVRYI